MSEDPLARHPAGVMLVADPSRFVLEVRSVTGLTVEAADAWKDVSANQYAIPAREETKRTTLRAVVILVGFAVVAWSIYAEGKMNWPHAIALAALAGTSIDFKSIFKKGAP